MEKLGWIVATLSSGVCMYMYCTQYNMGVSNSSNNNNNNNNNQELMKELHKTKELLAAERRGRITAEKKQRSLLQKISQGQEMISKDEVDGGSAVQKNQSTTPSHSPHVHMIAGKHQRLMKNECLTQHDSPFHIAITPDPNLEKEQVPAISLSQASTPIQKKTSDSTSFRHGMDRVRFPPIGYIRSPFRKRNGTPRQGGLISSIPAQIVLDVGRVMPEHSMSGIEEYSHVWLIWEFHENTNASGTVKAKVQPPRATNDMKVGIYSTRTPHRHNAIGLSVVSLLKVSKDKKSLYVGGADLVDGTPILDIKPYCPAFEGKYLDLMILCKK
jgi:tRNA-Thr(GGU) m(6)t(6)A37 methyltransferase TsaA